jgi:hypothetical protein
VGRARGLFELAISQPVLDMPEAVWKAYIDFEISQVGKMGALRRREEMFGIAFYRTWQVQIRVIQTCVPGSITCRLTNCLHVFLLTVCHHSLRKD